VEKTENIDKDKLVRKQELNRKRQRKHQSKKSDALAQLPILEAKIAELEARIRDLEAENKALNDPHWGSF
jgi:hypothetical protein